MLIGIASFIVFVLVLALIIKAFYPVQGSGVEATQEHASLQPFKALSLSGIGVYTVSKGELSAVSVTGDDNIIPLINVEVREGQLHIGLKGSAQPKLGVHVNIVTPSLEAVEVSGLVKLKSSHGELSLIEVSGLASLEAQDLKGERLDVALSGAGEVTLIGEVKEMSVDSSGASVIDATALRATRGEVKLSGAGLIKVNASEALKVQLSGLGKVEYLGQPELEEEVSGLGSIKSIEG